MNEMPTAETQANETFLRTLRHNARAIQPDPDFVATFEGQMAQIPTQKSRRTLPRIMRPLGAVAAVLILMTLTVVTVPPLRAIAQEIINLLVPANSDRQWRDIKGLTTGRESFASVQELETQLGLDVAVPLDLPVGVRVDKSEITVILDEAVYDPDTGMIILSYAPSPEQPNADGLVSHPYNNWWMWLNATPSDVYHAANDVGTVGASAQIETLSLTFQGHEISAQFVRGGWDIQGGLDDSKILEAGGTLNRAVQWVNDGRMSLTWKADGIVYAMHTTDDEVFHLTRDDLVRIAESME